MILPKVKRIDIDKKTEEEIKNCQHEFVLDSDPNSPCAKCPNKHFCKAIFYGTNDYSQFQYNEDELRRQSFIRSLGGEHEILGLD